MSHAWSWRRKDDIIGRQVSCYHLGRNRAETHTPPIKKKRMIQMIDVYVYGLLEVFILHTMENMCNFIQNKEMKPHLFDQRRTLDAFGF